MYSFGATCWTPSGKQNIPRFLLEGSSLTVLFGLSCLQMISAESPAILATKKDSKDISFCQLPADRLSAASFMTGARSAGILMLHETNISYGAVSRSQVDLALLYPFCASITSQFPNAGCLTLR